MCLDHKSPKRKVQLQVTIVLESRGTVVKLIPRKWECHPSAGVSQAGVTEHLKLASSKQHEMISPQFWR